MAKSQAPVKAIKKAEMKKSKNPKAKKALKKVVKKPMMAKTY